MEKSNFEMEKKRKYFKNLAAIFLIIFLLFSLTITVSLVGERTTFFGKAEVSVPLGQLSLENSYVFASPLSAQADGRENIRITIFLLDTEGLGLKGKRVYLGQAPALKTREIQPITDSLGKGVFDVSSTKKGEYFIEVGVEGKILSQKVRITFR